MTEVKQWKLKNEKAKRTEREREREKERGNVTSHRPDKVRSCLLVPSFLIKSVLWLSS